MTVPSSGTTVATLPLTDQLPADHHRLARPAARGRSERPFGLRFATAPTGTVELDLDEVDYDDALQIAVARDGDRWVPLARHSMGVTLQTSGRSPHEDEIYDKS